MVETLKYCKLFIYKIITYFIKKRWRKSSNLKVLISVNNYFDENKWRKTLLSTDKKILKEWDIIFCKNRFEIYKHFPEAEVCFLFSYISHLSIKDIKPKLLYFPYLGLEFIKDANIPGNFEIENPSPFRPAIAIAEYCIAMVILLIRNLHSAIHNQYNNKWNQKLILGNPFISIQSLKIGILGVGNIGKVISEYFKNLGCYVAGCDKNINNNLKYIDKWFNLYDLRTFLNFIDVLIIALPLTSETKNLIGFKELNYLGPSSYLINISRGNIINEKDLVKALKQGIIKGAVLDVFSKEPLSSFHAFYKLNNVIITPHVAGNINLFVNDIQKDFLEKALKFYKNV